MVPQNAVRAAGRPGCHGRGRPRPGFTLIELLCVTAIIAILLSLLLPVIFKAYHRVRSMAGEVETPTIAYRVRDLARAYCAANPKYYFTNRTDFALKCRLDPKCRDRVEEKSTEFVPFHYGFPSNTVVLTFNFPRRGSYPMSFTKADLTITPDD